MLIHLSKEQSILTESCDIFSPKGPNSVSVDYFCWWRQILVGGVSNSALPPFNIQTFMTRISAAKIAKKNLPRNIWGGGGGAGGGGRRVGELRRSKWGGSLEGWRGPASWPAKQEIFTEKGDSYRLLLTFRNVLNRPLPASLLSPIYWWHSDGCTNI